jgi:GntR family transcriptional regulator, transcriptional repressor for pyruvate dehydrogenase complex
MVEACAARVKRSILCGDLAVGARLPPERVLASDLGVNRTTLRAALRELANAGLLSARQGSGHVVRDFMARGGPDLVPMLAELARTKNELASVASDLLLVRRQLALGLLERLKGVSLEGDALAPVHRAVDAFEAAVVRNVPPTLAELCALDVAVVRALAALTGSKVLALFINPVEAILASVPALASAIYATPQENVAAYRALVTSLAAGHDATELVREALEARDAVTLSRLHPKTRRGTK